VTLNISSHAKRQLKKIGHDKELIARLRKAFDTITTDPYAGKDLGGDMTGILSFRVGSWRILYRVFRQQLIVLVISVGDRKEVYRFSEN